MRQSHGFLLPREPESSVQFLLTVRAIELEPLLTARQTALPLSHTPSPYLKLCKSGGDVRIS